jgi:hypothetical protein
MDLGGEVLVGGLRSTVADDSIGSVADRCLLSGIKQTSHFKGVRTVFDRSGGWNPGIDIVFAATTFRIGLSEDK